jgi:hypothetical protein
VIHGTIMVSRSALTAAGGYDSRFRYSADLDLYDRLIRHCRMANIAKPLLGIRRHDGQGSHTRLANTETIRIYMRRLASGQYSSRERAVLCGALALKVFVRLINRL